MFSKMKNMLKVQKNWHTQEQTKMKHDPFNQYMLKTVATAKHEFNKILPVQSKLRIKKQVKLPAKSIACARQ